MGPKKEVAFFSPLAKDQGKTRQEVRDSDSWSASSFKSVGHSFVWGVLMRLVVPS